MPRMDGTGPFGTGPIGRGLGPCGGGSAFQRNGLWGMGWRFFRGGRFGWGMTPTSLSTDEEKEMLEQQKSWLETQLAAITQRLQGFGQKKE
jgi:hypothetical protein